MPEIRVSTAPRAVTQASTAVRLDPGAAGAVGRGLVSLGGEIAQGGQFFAEMTKRKEASDDLAATVEFRTLKAKNDTLIQDGLRDPELQTSDWPAHLDKRNAEFIQGAGGDLLNRMSENQRLKVRGSFDVALETARINIKTQAFQADISKNRATLSASSDELSRFGNSPENIAEIEQLWADAVKTKTFGTEKAATELTRAKQAADIAENQFRNQSDPWENEEEIRAQIADPGDEDRRYKTATTDQISDFLSNARGAQSLIRTKNYEEYLGAIRNVDNPDERAKVWRQAENDEKGDKISEQQLSHVYNALFANHRSRKDIAGWAEASIAVDKFIANPNDPSLRVFLENKDDPVIKIKERLLDIVGDSNWDTRIQTNLISKLLAEDPHESVSSSGKRTATDARSQMTKLWTDGFFKSKAFFPEGFNERDLKSSNKAKREQAIARVDKANRIYSQHIDRADQFLSDNPGASLADTMASARQLPISQEARTQKAKELAGQLEPAQPSEKKLIATKRTSRIDVLRKDFPGISPEMTAREAVVAATKDAQAKGREGISAREVSFIMRTFE